MSGGRISGGRFPRVLFPFGLGGLALLALALSPKAVVVETHHHEAPPAPVNLHIEATPMVVYGGSPEAVFLERAAKQLEVRRALEEMAREPAWGPTGKGVVRESQADLRRQQLEVLEMLQNPVPYNVDSTRQVGQITVREDQTQVMEQF